MWRFTWSLVVVSGCGRVGFDDSTTLDVDACVSCRVAACGDGVVRPGVEDCDDGNTANGDGCSATCLRCEGGDARYTAPTGNCYTLDRTMPMPWGAAEDSCEIADAHLVAYQTAAEHDGVRSGLGLDSVAVWIGIGFFLFPEWVTGEPFAYTSWGTGEPSIGANAIVEQVDGRWVEITGFSSQAFVCEREPWRVDPTSGHAYRLVVNARSFGAARTDCQDRGGHLATITSTDELGLVQAVATGPAWVGLTDSVTEGAYEWITGEAVAVLGWRSGEPDSAATADDCIVQAEGGWDDIDCALPRNYVCEIE